jgi:hypothetical protein
MTRTWATRVVSERRLLSWTFVTFFAVGVLAAVDLWADLREGTAWSHVLVEGGILLVALLGTILMARQLVRTLRRARDAQQEAIELAEQLDVTRA